MPPKQQTGSSAGNSPVRLEVGEYTASPAFLAIRTHIGVFSTLADPRAGADGALWATFGATRGNADTVARCWREARRYAALDETEASLVEAAETLDHVLDLVILQAAPVLKRAQDALRQLGRDVPATPRADLAAFLASVSPHGNAPVPETEGTPQ